MRLWADVYDATNATRQGEGPVLLRSANIKRALDGPGIINVTLAGWEKRAVDLIQPKRVLRIYTDQAGGKRLIGQMVVDDISRGDGNNKSFTVTGRDLLTLLSNTNTGLGRSYDNQSVTAIVTALAALAGWTVNAEAVLSSVTTSARFDGASVLRAIQSALEEKGAHLRLSTTVPDELDIGYFGEDNGLRAESPSQAHRDLYENDALLLINDIREVRKSSDVVNAILPLGAGDGDAALTIAKSTRGRAIIRTGGDGRAEYWLEDAASISTYGRIERRVDFKKIAPITNSSGDVQNAANALDDASWTWLGRHTEPRVTYALSCRKVPVTIAPGNKLTVSYRGQITSVTGDVVDVERIRGLYWIVSVSESWGVEGGRLELEISNVDAVEAGSEGIIVGAIDAVQVQGVAVKPFPFVNSYVYRREMASGFPASVPIDITNAVLDITRVRVRVRTEPFRSNVTGAASGGGATSSSGGGVATTTAGGGDHNHRVLSLTSISGFPSTINRPYVGRNSSGGAFLFVTLGTSANSDLWTEASSGSHTHSINISPHTHDVPAHTHNLQYGIFDDNQYPQSIDVYINGVDRTTEVGGRLATGGNVAINTVLEISDILKSGTLQQLHTVELRPAAGRGEVEVTVEVYGVMQTINV